MTRWTEEQLAALRARYPHERTLDIAADIGRSYTATNAMAAKLGLRKTEAYMEEQLGRFKDGGRRNQFKPGQEPPNKGLRRPGWHKGRMRETQFKPGHKSNPEMQVGQCAIETKQKMWKRKMCMSCRGGPQWMSLPRYIWMMANGPIPPGHVVRVEGWDKNNPEPIEAVTLDRLTCIPKSQNMLRNSIHRYPKEVVDVVMQAGRLQREINKQEGRHGEKRSAKRKRTDDFNSAGAPVRHAGGSTRQG
ncbi:MAG TPA: hypothetical protein PKH39_18580 [Woeseiaceae bacterium]|nr:hypothetical protein [Woeseiaceae bacterium]